MLINGKSNLFIEKPQCDAAEKALTESDEAWKRTRKRCNSFSKYQYLMHCIHYMRIWSMGTGYRRKRLSAY